jgi:hypothetical protein
MIKALAILFIGIFLIGAVSAEIGKITAYVVGDSDNQDNDSQMVGNDRDSHGCIGSAGYSWCEEKSKCLRIWEENCSSIEELKNESGLKAGSIKVLPETASARAQEVLGLKCEERNCTIVLKEVPTSNGTRMAYEVTSDKEVKVLGFIKTKMQVQAQVDAETGEIIRTKKPFWRVFAVE